MVVGGGGVAEERERRGSFPLSAGSRAALALATKLFNIYKHKIRDGNTRGNF